MEKVWGGVVHRHTPCWPQAKANTHTDWQEHMLLIPSLATSIHIYPVYPDPLIYQRHSEKVGGHLPERMQAIHHKNAHLITFATIFSRPQNFSEKTTRGRHTAHTYFLWCPGKDTRNRCIQLCYPLAEYTE